MSSFLLGTMCGSLGVSWEPLEASWESHGQLLGASWEPLGSLLGASWEPLGSLLEPLGAILGRLGAKLGGLGATFGSLRFLIIFWNDFGSKKGAQREAFWEPKRSKSRSKKEVQI